MRSFGKMVRDVGITLCVTLVSAPVVGIISWCMKIWNHNEVRVKLRYWMSSILENSNNTSRYTQVRTQSKRSGALVVHTSFLKPTGSPPGCGEYRLLIG